MQYTVMMTTSKTTPLGKCLRSEFSPKKMQISQKHGGELCALSKPFSKATSNKIVCKLIKPSASVKGVHSDIVWAIAHSDNRELERMR